VTLADRANLRTDGAAERGRDRRTHSTHCTPTGAGTRQAGQIGRSQRWQRTPVSRSGWR